MMEEELFEKLYDFFKGKSDEEVVRWFEEFKDERAIREEKRTIEDLEILLKSQADALGRRMPEIGPVFAEEASRVAKYAVDWVHESKSPLPTVLSVVGSRDKRYPIEGLLKIAKIEAPKSVEVELNTWIRNKYEPGKPYALMGVNAIYLEDVSPEEAEREYKKQGRSRPPFDLDDAAAIFMQGIDYFGILPYSILVLGSVWDSQAVVIRSDLGGKRSLVKVPWNETIFGQVLVPTSDGAETLLFY